MRTGGRACVIAAAMALSAAQAAPDPHDVLKVKVDQLLESVRANDRARFGMLIGRRSPDSSRDEGSLIGDHAIDPDYDGPLTITSLRRFADECRYVSGDRRDRPRHFSGIYDCRGEFGHTIDVEFSDDGQRAISITLMSPENHRELAELNAQISAADAQSEAQRLAALSRVAGTVNALFAAALAGDRARFDALVGRGVDGAGPVLADDRSGARQSGPLTLEAVAPIAAQCVRGDGEPYQTVDLSDQLNHQAPYICDGVPGFVLYTGFEEEGTKIGWLRIEGQLALPFP